MFIGEEFDDDNDRDSSVVSRSPTTSKLKQLEMVEDCISEEDEASGIKSPDEVRIPVITHEDMTEDVKSQSPHLKIMIPFP